MELAAMVDNISHCILVAEKLPSEPELWRIIRIKAIAEMDPFQSNLHEV
jgi:hypothetical protein